MKALGRQGVTMIALLATVTCQKEKEPTRATADVEQIVAPPSAKKSHADAGSPSGHEVQPPSGARVERTNTQLSESAQSRVIKRRASELALHGIDGAQLVEFLSELRNSVDRNDRKAVARLVKYPLLVNIGDRSLKFRTSRDFLSSYEEVLTTRLKQEIDAATICNVAALQQAVTIGGDVVWIRDLNGIGIVTINVPAADAPGFMAGGCQGDAAIEGVGCMLECQ